MNVKNYFLVLLILFITLPIQAQVTIGSDKAPRDGAILDIKTNENTGKTANSTGGLGLPRVELSTLTTLTVDVASKKNDYVGLLVYNVTTNSELEEGVYYWDGTKWVKAGSAVSSALHPWYKIGTTNQSENNTDDSYITSKVVIGDKTIGSVNGGTNNAQLTVTGGDALVNGVTVGKGRGNAVYNTAIGSLALSANTTGAYNTAIGRTALTSNTLGGSNTALGYNALRKNLDGSGNTALGYETLSTGTSGYNNTAIGNSALTLLAAGDENTAIGNKAANKQIAGSKNIAIGYDVNLPNLAGLNQINIGNSIFGTVGASLTDMGSVSIGKTAPDAGVKLDVEGVTQITGANALRYKDGNQGAGKVLISDASGNASWGTAASSGGLHPWYKVGTTSQSENNTDNSYITSKVVIGDKTIGSVNGGTNNAQLTVTGGDALINSMTVGRGKGSILTNTAFGANALSANSTGSGNVAVGTLALGRNTTAESNTAIGYNTLAANTTAEENTAVGRNALAANTTGPGNTAIGYNALTAYTGTAGGNLAIGYNASSKHKTGTRNIAIGYNAGANQTSGNGNIVIGDALDLPDLAGTNQLNIGNTIFGKVSMDPTYPGRISLGKTIPDLGVRLDVNGLTQLNDLKYTKEPGDGKVLTSDASGNAAWIFHHKSTVMGGMSSENFVYSYRDIVYTKEGSGNNVYVPKPDLFSNDFLHVRKFKSTSNTSMKYLLVTLDINYAKATTTNVTSANAYWEIAEIEVIMNNQIVHRFYPFHSTPEDGLNTAKYNLSHLIPIRNNILINGENELKIRASISSSLYRKNEGQGQGFFNALETNFLEIKLINGSFALFE